MDRKSFGTSSSTVIAALALSGVPAAPALASVREVCDVTAKVISIEEVSALGAGSRKIVSELDPTQVRFNSFVTLMTLEVLDAIPFAPSTACSADLKHELQKVIMDVVPGGITAGVQARFVREFYLDLTPQGIAYEVIWSVPLDR